MPRACMIVHSHYPADPRVRREAESLLADGWAVDVICLRDPGEKPREECAGATVYRIPVTRHRASGLAVYLWEYLLFFFAASFRVTALHLRRRYDVVQAHNMPDFLVFAAAIPRLLGARVVLDIHDLVPELYGVKFTGRGSRLVARITRMVEYVSTAFADQVITAGEPFRRRLLARQVPAEKVTVVMNSADPRLFHPLERAPANPEGDNRFTLVYHGGLFHRYGLDIAVRAVHRLREEIPDLQFRIYGDGDAVPELEQLIGELRLEERVHLGGFVPLDRIPALIAGADLGVVPYRQNPFTDLLFPTKAFEYIVMGVPVIMARTEAVVTLFGEVSDLFFQPGDDRELAERILALYKEPARRQLLLAVSRAAYAPYAWDRQQHEYLALMNRLVTGRGSMPALDSFKGRQA